MPVLNVTTSASVLAPTRADEFVHTLSRVLAKELNKPESYLMILVNYANHMAFGGSNAPACYAELKNIGEFTPEATVHLSQLLCTQLSEGLGVAKNRIFIEFSNPAPHLFGFDSETFA